MHDAYRLFLAEKALDAGLRPHDLLAELGYATALRPLLKYPGQPRNPVGDPAGGGRFAIGRAGDPASASIVPVFLDTRHKQEEPATLPDPMHPVPSLQPGLPDLDLLPAGAPLPLPFLAPKVEPDEKEKDGPSCPPEKPDVPNGSTAAAEAWERFVHGIVNPSDPTKDEHAYYLPNPSYQPGGRLSAFVSYDDCKKSDEPSRIPGIKRGDMVDAKDNAFNWLYGMPWDTSLDRLDKQLQSQNNAIKHEGRGRRLFYCYDGDFAAALARSRYGKTYKNTTF